MLAFKSTALLFSALSLMLQSSNVMAGHVVAFASTEIYDQREPSNSLRGSTRSSNTTVSSVHEERSLLESDSHRMIPVFLHIKFDQYAEETYWYLVDESSNEVVHSVKPGHYSKREEADEVVERLDVPEGKDYKLVMKDVFGDGLVAGGYFDLSYDGYMWGTPLMTIEKVEDFKQSEKRVVKFTARKYEAPMLTNSCERVDGKVCVSLSIQLDDFPEETAWRLFDHTNSELEFVLPGSFNTEWDKGSQIHHQWLLEPGQMYFFLIMDSFGDGLSHPNGFFEISYRAPGGGERQMLSERISNFDGDFIWVGFTVPGSAKKSAAKASSPHSPHSVVKHHKKHHHSR